ncbi:MAG TPA: hypothetical protein VKN73_15430, partial [Desulfosalsimonadaceae bacterium]|nr:hypothetical protein [Desulfosalsimonadaceae bacterium]
SKPTDILKNFENEYRMLLGMYKADQMEKDPLVINDRYQDTNEEDTEAGKKAPVQSIRCKAINRNGVQCHNRAATNSLYCTIHQNKYENLADLDKSAKEGTDQASSG